MKKDLEKLLDEWRISDAEEFKEDLDSFGEDEVSSDALDRILSASMKKAGYRHEGAITMNRTTKNIKNDQSTGYGEVSRFRGVAAIAACLAITVTGIIAAKTMFGSRIGTDEGAASSMQVTEQLPAQNTEQLSSAPDDSVNAAVTDSADESKPEETSAPAETSEPDTSSINEAVEPKKAVAPSITPEEILSMSIEELKELSNNEYEIVKSKWSPQHQCYGYRFKAFPEYVCAFDGLVNPDEVEFKESFETKFPPNWIEVDPGVDMGDGVYAGMTYNELKELSNGNIYMDFTWRWLIRATVDGKQYCFEIEDLTDEELGILGDRLDSSTQQNENGYPAIDASDVDPTTTYGIIFSWNRMDEDEWAINHYKGVDDEWLKSMYDEETLKKYGY